MEVKKTTRAELGDVLAVFVGGAIGTCLRAIIAPEAGWATLAINVVGAFVLGALTGLFLRANASHRVRLLLGTGLLGGFTTYSALAVMGTDPQWVLPVIVTVVVGPLLAFVGLFLTRRKKAL